MNTHVKFAETWAQRMHANVFGPRPMDAEGRMTSVEKAVNIPKPAPAPKKEIPASVSAWGGGGTGPGGSSPQQSGGSGAAFGKFDDMAGLYGLGGAGAGALFGAAVGNKKNRMRNALIGGGLGGGAGLLANYLMNAPGKTANEKQANPLAGVLDSARGALGNIKSEAGLGSMYGGLGGAALGGLSGLIAPGSETEYDENGNPVGTKRRSRFGAALRRALGGGVLGAIGGGVAGQFAPDATQKAIAALQGHGNKALGYGEQLARRVGYRGKSQTAPSPTTGSPVTQPGLTTSGTLAPGVDTRNMREPVSATAPATTYGNTVRGDIERSRSAMPARQIDAMKTRAQEMEQAMGTQPSRSGFDNLSPEHQESLLRDAARQQREKELARLSPATTNLDAAGLDMSGLDTNSPGSATMGR